MFNQPSVSVLPIYPTPTKPKCSLRWNQRTAARARARDRDRAHARARARGPRDTRRDARRSGRADAGLAGADASAPRPRPHSTTSAGRRRLPSELASPPSHTTAGPTARAGGRTASSCGSGRGRRIEDENRKIKCVSRVYDYVFFSLNISTFISTLFSSS